MTADAAPTTTVARRRGSLRFLVRLAWHADRWRCLAVLVPIMPIVFTAMPLTLRAVIDAIPRDDRTTIAIGSIVLAATLVLGVGVGFAQFKASVRLGDNIGFELDRRLIALTTQIHGIDHFERAEHLDRMEMLRTQRFALREAMSNLRWSIEGSTGVLLTVGLLASVHPLLALLPLATLPALVLGGPAQRGIDDATERVAPISRRALHLFDVATLPGPAKEIRVFGVRDEIRRRYDDAWRGADREIDRANRRAVGLRVLGTAVATAGYALALWWLWHLARRGSLSGGELYLAVSVATRLTDQMGRSAGTVGQLRHARNVADRFMWLDDYANEARTAIAARTATMPDRLRDGIVLDHVSFGYGDGSDESLRDVSLQLPAGTVVALVGENGAGKSTLCKLLFGFYQPTAGAIRVDGVDLADIDPATYRSRTAACVQDHARLQFLAGEAIGVGDVAHVDDEARIAAATERAAATDVIDVLPAGYAERLGTVLGGTDLSGGQWQKVAIARAMMRDDPLLVVLDEPTSALDPLAEHALFARYADVARERAARHGTITVLVSHRFSTVRIADLIVVLDDGRVVEHGTHDELIAQRGQYHDLYELQAQHYR